MKPRTASATSYGVRPPRLSLGVEFMWSTIVLKSHCVRYSKLVAIFESKMFLITGNIFAHASSPSTAVRRPT